MDKYLQDSPNPPALRRAVHNEYNGEVVDEKEEVVEVGDVRGETSSFGRGF